jgi:hypothetical protein
MIFRRLLKFSLIGFVFQVILMLIAPFAAQGYRDTLGYFYEPWAFRGESLFPSGPAGHAGVGGGFLLGLMLGAIIYSLLVGMVNFDSFGFNYPQVLSNASSPRMTKLAKDLAKEVNMPFSEAAINNADADSSSFVEKDIPAITFHGLSNKWQEYLHSSKDKIENVNFQSVLIGYNFAYLFVSRIDQGACGMFRKQ